MKIRILLFLLFCLAAAAYSLGGGHPDYHGISEYWHYSGGRIRVSWDPSGGDYYEAKIIQVESGQEYPLGITADTSIEFTLPRTGHFDFYCRTCDSFPFPDSVQAVNPESGLTAYCTPWAVSTDPNSSLVMDDEGNWIHGAWRIYSRLAPPGTPVFGGPPLID